MKIVIAFLFSAVNLSQGFPSVRTGDGVLHFGSKRQANFGSFDPNALYNQQSFQMQSYLSQSQPKMGDGQGSGGSSGGDSSSSSSGTGASSASSGTGASSASSGSSSGSGGVASFDPNSLYQQQSSMTQQNLQSSQKDSQAPNYNGNNVNQIQASLTDPSSSKLGQSGGASSGFDPDKFNSLSFNLFNPQNQMGK
ncbi:hypothetical protein CHS0354_015533 [Potamilus streckersoni]|uniref:Uncharacterized protein n=1 Tax=Potamilus streckersoni TaxID=2493646 RepID=A0AAE0T6U2_9BIVA|nr:hypothetical protein CHS0354_015533 [Potamilus streckersoni]